MILIISNSEDLHARIVHHALLQIGADAVFWDPSMLALEQQFVLTLAEPSHARVYGRTGDWSSLEITTVWYRRDLPVRRPSNLAASAFEAFDQEWVTAKKAIYHMLRDSTWINKWESAIRAENKWLQMISAKKIGLSTPHTIVSNQHGAIQEFTEQNSGKVVHKMFFPTTFSKGKHSYTARLTADALRKRASIQISPSIYQAELMPDFEVRLLVMGDTCIAAKLMTGNRDALDIRESLCRHGSIEPIEAPLPIKSMARQLLASLNLATGSFDFVVTKSGDWHFLEVNQAGQFLWLEAMSPEIPALREFCQYLLATDHQGCNASHAIRLSDYDLDDLALQFGAAKHLARGGAAPAQDTAAQTSAHV